MKKLLFAASTLIISACSNNTTNQANTQAETIKQDTVAAESATDSTNGSTENADGHSGATAKADSGAKADSHSGASKASKVEGAENYIRKMNKMGVPCFIDKDNSLHIELMENINGDYNELASYTLREAISNGVKGITTCNVYYERELVGTASLKQK